LAFSSEAEVVFELLERNSISKILENLKIQTNKKSLELHCMLLCNITHTTQGSKKLLQIGEPLSGVNISKLIETFVFKERFEPEDPLAWIAQVLMNITQLAEGRLIMLDKERNIFPLLLPFIRDSNVKRRQGVLGIIKNCCFQTEKHDYLLMDEEVNILKHLLYPIRGSETLSEDDMKGLDPSLHNSVIGKDKKREDDIECKGLIIKSLVLLTATRTSREFLRKSKVYPILREYEKHEENDEINNDIHEVVDILMLQDEEPTDTTSNSKSSTPISSETKEEISTNKESKKEV